MTTRGKDGDEERRLLEKHERLVRQEVSRGLRAAPWARAFEEDLRQEARIALFEAWRHPHRDPHRPFEPWARTFIGNRLRNHAEVTRGADRVLLARVMAAIDSLLARDVRGASNEEIAREAARLDERRAERLKKKPPTPLTADDVERALQMLAVADVRTLESLAEDGWEPPDPDPARFLAVDPGWHQRFLDAFTALLGAATELNERTRQIVALDLFHVSNDDIARIVGISPKAVPVRKSESLGVVRTTLERCLCDAGVEGKACTCISAMLFPPGGRAGLDAEKLELVSHAEEFLAQALSTLSKPTQPDKAPPWLRSFVEVLFAFVRRKAVLS
jgi:DNA-directed RNA polymerase specialized sigma subunit